MQKVLFFFIFFRQCINSIRNNDLIEFKQPVVNIIKRNDEYDVNEMKNKLHQYDRVYIKGLLHGTDKTTGAKNSGYKLQFVTPYNKLCQELRKEIYNSVTLNKLLNINIVGEYNKKAKQHDISQYEAIYLMKFQCMDLII